ncbi:MAG: hypothetical protein GMKNLPBB_02598 [Myxococcota bacterium]|nr:hypothetical protein [Myxococcota bacterium]
MRSFWLFPVLLMAVVLSACEDKETREALKKAQAELETTKRSLSELQGERIRLDGELKRLAEQLSAKTKEAEDLKAELDRVKSSSAIASEPLPGVPEVAKMPPGKLKNFKGTVYALIKTNLGDIKLKLYHDKAPLTVANFIGLASGVKEWKDPRTGQMMKDKRFYDGVIFHRVIPGFMIQGGDPLGVGMGGPGYTFADEFHPSLSFNKPGLLAMANSGPATNGSQFFITDKDSLPSHLNNRHSIFGEVVEGLDVVNRIANTPRGGNDRPNTPVVMQRVIISQQ